MLLPQASSALEDPGCLKCEEQAANAAHILAVMALKYQQLDNVTGGWQRRAVCRMAALLLRLPVWACSAASVLRASPC